MKYQGKIYGKAGSQYFPLMQNSDNIERMDLALKDISDQAQKTTNDNWEKQISEIKKAAQEAIYKPKF